jgi:hypothetical protein
VTPREVSAAWVPVRYVQHAQKCCFCQNRIPKGSPGATKGTRGTKAWWNRITGAWECVPCRTEGFRAEAARDALIAEAV